MFNRLRNKFLILNLVIISVMMLISFTAIYLMTYNNVHREIDLELRRISEFNRKQADTPKNMIPNTDGVKPSTFYDGGQPAPGRSAYFTLITDSKGKIMDYYSVFEMDSEFFESAKSEALSTGSDIGSFKLEDNYWQFIVKPYPDGYRIAFLDITSQQGILTNLIYTFLIVAFAMLVVIYFISRFFANRSIEPIKEAFEKQKQFIADASHELKTPLAVINTNVDVVLSNGENSVSSQSKWLHYVKSEAERMSKLTNDLLYLTQMDYSDAKMVFSAFNLSEPVESTILTMEAVIYENDISLNYSIEPDIIISGNCEQIKQVVMILLDNALKYTNPKGSVDIVLSRYHNNAVLSVTNTGAGIPAESINRIFDRFFRVDKARSRSMGGYGLGLAIARAIVEQHGGRITARSTVNASTTFSIELPII